MIGDRRSFDDLGDNIVRNIAAERENHLEMTGRVNDQGAKIVIEAAGIGGVVNSANLGEFMDLVGGTR